MLNPNIYTQFHTDGIITPPVQAIFKCLDVSVQTLAEANEYAQKNLLRIGEFWDTQPDKPVHQKICIHQEIILNALEDLGMLSAIVPCAKTYSYVIVLGSLYEDVIQRLEFLSNLLHVGYHFENRILLGSERPLLEYESRMLPANMATESQMMAFLWSKNQQLNKHTVSIISQPLLQEADGMVIKRPTTETTLEYFAQETHRPGSCLIISNNPYITRQLRIAQRALNQIHFPTEGAGPKFNNGNIPIILLIDEFARILYEEHKAFYK